MTETPDVVLFFGRFHPLMVHLPIGFLILAVVMELSSRLPRFEALRPAIPFAWLLGAISAAVAVILGYLLSLGGGYEADTLFWHQWLGIAMTILSLVIYLSGKTKSPSALLTGNRFRVGCTLILAVLLTVTGHLGGNLTHGSTYLLEHAPNPVRQLAGLPVKKSRVEKEITSLDSADIFADAIMPIMEAKCVSCHSNEKQKGDLLLTSYPNMLKGGETRAAVVPGDLAKSELFRRITLPEDHKEFMPTDGKTPLTEEQVAIIQWWIEKGAKPRGTIGSFAPGEEVAKLFSDYFGMNADGLWSLEVAPPNAQMIDTLMAQGFQFYYLAAGSHLIEGNLHISGTKASEVNMEDLLVLKEQLVWLQLPNCEVQDEHLQTIGQLSELRKLDLSQNQVTDEGITLLMGLSQLEYLNVYGNEITDEALATLLQLSNLKRLYLRETKVTLQGIHQLIEQKPDLKIFYEVPEML